MTKLCYEGLEEVVSTPFSEQFKLDMDELFEEILSIVRSGNL